MFTKAKHLFIISMILFSGCDNSDEVSYEPALVNKEVFSASHCSKVNLPTTFVACGGDIQGKWVNKGICFDTTNLSATMSKEKNGQCAGTEVFMDIDANDAAVTADKSQISLTPTQGTLTMATIRSTSCISETECKTQAGCSIKESKCVCEKTTPSDYFGNIRYTVNGNYLIPRSAKASNVKPLGFCVTGNTMAIELPNDITDVNVDRAFLLLERSN